MYQVIIAIPIRNHHQAMGLFHHQAMGLFHHQAMGLFHHQAMGLFHHQAMGLFHHQAMGLLPPSYGIASGDSAALLIVSISDHDLALSSPLAWLPPFVIAAHTQNHFIRGL